MKCSSDFVMTDISRLRRTFRRLKFWVCPPDAAFANGSSPLIIGGCARSGTTLLQSALSAHPAIRVIPYETQAFCNWWYYGTEDEPRVFKLSSVDRYFSQFRIPRGVRYWCEKTPRNIQVFADLLDTFGKRIRLLQIVRDGRDVICSIHPDDPGRFWVNSERWIDDVTAGLAYLNHPQVMTLRYEDLVERFEQVMMAVYDFLEIKTHGVCYDYPNGSLLQYSNAWSGSARPVRSGSVGRWRRAEFQNRVQELEGRSDARDLLKVHGYAI